MAPQADAEPPILEPGASTPIQVSTEPCETESDAGCRRKSDEVVEFTVVAVDKAILELVPYGLRDVAMDFVFSLSRGVEVASSSDNLFAPGAIDAVVENFIRGQRENPWAFVDGQASICIAST